MQTPQYAHVCCLVHTVTVTATYCTTVGRSSVSSFTSGGRHRGTGLTTFKLVNTRTPLMREGCETHVLLYWVYSISTDSADNLHYRVHVCDCFGLQVTQLLKGRHCMHCKARGEEGETPTQGQLLPGGSRGELSKLRWHSSSSSVVLRPGLCPVLVVVIIRIP